METLFIREIRTRFGKFCMGYQWAILEPSVHLLGIGGYV
ncbi:TPA: ABC transporter permease, partial [Escherichia coli]